jgi:hypothetical protein
LSLEPYQTAIAIVVSIISGAAGGITIYSRLRKKKPNIVLQPTTSSWRHRNETCRHTDIYVTLLLQNKGEAATTVNDLSMTIEYRGNNYTTTPAERDNIMLDPGASSPKQFRFVVNKDVVMLDGSIDRATITANTTHGKSKSVEIKDVRQQ